MDIPHKLKPFTDHGVEFESQAGDEYIGGCPFCHKEVHFYVNGATGQYMCHSCNESGNVIKFLTWHAKQVHEATTPADFKRLSKLRGLPVRALKRFKLGFDGERWLLPCFSEKGTVRDIRRWKPPKGKVMSTTGCKTQLFGADRLAKPDAPVWLCEGEWDAIAIRELLRLAERKGDVVLGVPGAGVFKSHWARLLQGRHVRICYDNDGAGDNGSARAARELTGVASKIEFLCWPDSRPKGFDIRDYCVEMIEKDVLPKKALRRLKKLLKSEHRRDGAISQAMDSVEDAIIEVEPKDAPSFSKTMAVFEEWISMGQEEEYALRLMFAVALSGPIPGDPLWMFIVSPPGGGKTLLLASLGGSPKAIVCSTITPRALVSGHKSKDDPSLLPRLDKRCLVWKDFTELLALHQADQDQVWATLRGAYDGYVMKVFGNGVRREYHVRFAMLAAVTPIIHGHSKSTLGERFLKFQMQPGTAKNTAARIMAAIANVALEDKMDSDLHKAAEEFLARRVEASVLPGVPMWVKDRVVALSQLIGLLRAQVDREQYGDRDVKYRPHSEVGTRLAKQLIKLGQMLAFVDDKPKIDGDVYRLMERVAFDTAIGFHLDIVQALMDGGGEGTRAVLAERTGLPTTNLQRRLDDLKLLKVIKVKPQTGPKAPKAGRHPHVYLISKRVRTLWKQAKVGEDHVGRSVAARRKKGKPKKA